MMDASVNVGFPKRQWLYPSSFLAPIGPLPLTFTSLTDKYHRVMPFRLGPFLSDHAATPENRFHRTTKRCVTSSDSPTQPTTN